MKRLLSAMYATRAIAILAYLAAPKEAWTFYVFSAVLGATWLATVPPTAGLTAKLFGTRYLATYSGIPAADGLFVTRFDTIASQAALFGLSLLVHQVGAFFGAWLGGVAVAHTGNLTWMWWADAALAFAAALVNLPISEAKLQPRLAAA